MYVFVQLIVLWWPKLLSRECMIIWL